ncbi:MAG: hypothetical protein ABSC61_03570, partial [Anaerolineales bacterium]
RTRGACPSLIGSSIHHRAHRVIAPLPKHSGAMNYILITRGCRRPPPTSIKHGQAQTKLLKEPRRIIMDEQELLHKISVDTNINIELLKDLYKNDELWTLIRSGKNMDAIMLLRSIAPRVGLREAKKVVEAFFANI